MSAAALVVEKLVAEVHVVVACLNAVAVVADGVGGAAWEDTAQAFVLKLVHREKSASRFVVAGALSVSYTSLII